MSRCIETDDEDDDDSEEEDPILNTAQSSSIVGGESRHIEENSQAEEDNTQNESFAIDLLLSLHDFFRSSSRKFISLWLRGSLLS